VWQCVVVCGSVLQCVTVGCSVLQCVALCYFASMQADLAGMFAILSMC